MNRLFFEHIIDILEAAIFILVKRISQGFKIDERWKFLWNHTWKKVCPYVNINAPLRFPSHLVFLKDLNVTKGLFELIFIVFAGSFCTD